MDPSDQVALFTALPHPGIPKYRYLQFTPTLRFSVASKLPGITKSPFTVLPHPEILQHRFTVCPHCDILSAQAGLVSGSQHLKTQSITIWDLREGAPCTQQCFGISGLGAL